jgi:hypothetical protein
MLLTAVFLAATVAGPAWADGFSFGFGYNSAPRYYSVPRTVVYSEPTVVYRDYRDVVVYDPPPRVTYFSSCAPAPVRYYSSYGPRVVYERPAVYRSYPTYTRSSVYRSYPTYARSSGGYLRSYPSAYRGYDGPRHSYRHYDQHRGGARVRVHWR